MIDLKQVTYCGLYCGLCSMSNRVPRMANDLQETLRKEAIEYWGPDMPGFDEFWKFLGDLAGSETRCSCREETCGPPFCGIRKCAREKGVDVCPFCDEYPCEKVAGIAKGYVTMLADGKRMKEIGLDMWIKEQEKRKVTGFAYVDIRCEPFDVPED